MHMAHGSITDYPVKTQKELEGDEIVLSGPHQLAKYFIPNCSVQTIYADLLKQDGWITELAKGQG